MGRQIAKLMIMDKTFMPEGAEAPSCAADTLRLAAFQERSVVAGPGQRAVIWVAGCLRRCPGCIKPEFLSFDAGEQVSITELAKRILDIPDLDGVTFSGGEPFEQALPLGNLSRILKSDGLSIAAYTGYRLEALQNNRQRFGNFLDAVDMLIDGEYRQDVSGPLRWRGSSNQQIHVLTAEGHYEDDSDQAVREIQLVVDERGMRVTGFPDAATLKALATRLKSRGIVLETVQS